MKKKKINLRDIDTKENSGGHSHDDGHSQGREKKNFRTYLPAIFSFVMLIIGIALDYFDILFFKDWVRMV